MCIQVFSVFFIFCALSFLFLVLSSSLDKNSAICQLFKRRKQIMKMQRIQFTQISVVCLFYFKHLTKTEQCSYNPLQQHKLKSVVNTTTLNTTVIQRHIQNPVKHLRQSRIQSNTQNGASFKKKLFSQNCFILDV